MATRSTIALEFADGTIGQVYCHWDGYLSHNGKILVESYQDPFKVRELIDQGDISSLAPEIGIKHPFDNPASFGTPEYQAYKDQYSNMCKFYMRDRGEEGVEARYYKDYAEYRAEAQSEEYNYILRKDGNWYVEFYGEFDGLLKQAIMDEQDRVAQEEA
jgi:hypothetical protein